MKAWKKVLVTTVAASGAALLAAQPAFARHESGSARSVSEVRSIDVDSKLCPSRISSALSDQGFVVTNSGRPDAVLVVDVATDGSLADQDTMEEASYTARLIGKNGRVLHTASGTETNSNLGWLCADIGDSIADGLEERTS